MLSTVAIGIAALVTAGLLLALMLPVAAVLAAVALLALVMLALVSSAPMAMLDLALAAIGEDLAALLLSPQIAALPLVLLLGNLAFYGGIATRIYDAAGLWLRDRPGGLAMAALVGCGGFAALTGSSAHNATTMGRICSPELLRRGYDKGLVAASVAMGGLQGALVLPAAGLVLYALLSGISVGAMFLAGLLPAALVLAAALLAVALWLRGDRAAGPAVPDPAPAARADALRTIWPALLLPCVLAVALLAGLEVVAALGLCAGLALVSGIGSHRVSGTVLARALHETLSQLLQWVLILIAARLFYVAIGQSGLGLSLAGWASAAGLSPLAGMFLLGCVAMVLGIFIQPVAVLALLLPILLPVAEGLQMDLVWTGVVLILVLEFAQILPLVGVNLFVLAAVARPITMEQASAGMTRFIAPFLLVLLVLLLFPSLVLFLPGLAG